MRLRYAISSVGLHARPAAVFVQAVLDSGSAVRIGRSAGDPNADGADGAGGAGSVDARSIVSVLTLDIKPGEAIVLIGEDERVLDRLAAILESI